MKKEQPAAPPQPLQFDYTPLPGSPFYHPTTTFHPESRTPLTGDVELDRFSISGSSDGTLVQIFESLVYVHSDRTVIKRGSASNGVEKNELVLDSIPDSIQTREELIRYAMTQGVRFWNY